MRKLILTLFLASASLVSFAQSTVKTIRMATPASAFAGNIPQGTQVVVLSTNVVYTATVGIASTTVISAAITSGWLVTVTDTSVYSVIDEVEAGTGSNIAISVTPSLTPDGAVAGSIVASDFKVYVNGTLLLKSAYTFSGGDVTITTGIYEFDQVSVVYNTIK
jgi:hypothetical protein